MGIREQKEFDEKYISSTEIARRVGVTRPAMHFRRKAGDLPGAIDVAGQLFLWERDAIEPHIVRWEMSLKAKREPKNVEAPEVVAASN